MTPIIGFAGLVLLCIAGGLTGRATAILLVPRYGRVMAAAGVVVGLFLGIIHYSKTRRDELEARRGWDLVPVVIAATDIKRGQLLTFDRISQRAIPEQFVSEDLVKSDDVARAVNRPAANDLREGDLVYWGAICVKAR